MFKMKLRKRQANAWWKFGIILVIFAAGYLILGSNLPQSLDEFTDIQQVSGLDREPSLSLVGDGASRGCGRHLLEVVSSNKSGIYPPDVFTLEQKKKGAVIIHVIGMIYMFAALAIVCDEFFVPALGVIIENLDVSDDVAGATFMAAGGSAPELSTSIIGVFLAKSDVGIGTIVGSAVFNILFVIGMCAVFSKTVLHLTWWPLFRDCMFYFASILVLIGCFYNYRIEWYESIALLSMYALYVTFMKYNMQIESWVKNKLQKNNRIANGREASSDINPSQVLLARSSTSTRLSPPQASPTCQSPSCRSSIPSGSDSPLQPPSGDPSPLPADPNQIYLTETNTRVLQIRRSMRCKSCGQLTFQEQRTTISRQRRVSISQFRNTSMYRQGALQLLLHTLDPLRESQSSDEKLGESMENVSRPPPAAEAPASAAENPQRVLTSSTSANNLIIHAKGEMIIGVNGVTASSSTNGNLFIGANGDMAITVRGGNIDSSEKAASKSCEGVDTTEAPPGPPAETRKADLHVRMMNGSDESTLAVPGQNGRKQEDMESGKVSEPESLPEDVQEELEEPLDLAFPKGIRKRITYILLMPLVLPLWLTLPDVRRMEKRKWFPVTFLGSIFWIAIFAYLMVWWAVEVAETINIHEPVMGLTFLAAGTSIPDLITSVIVARKGLGDMAVSSSVGSNIFDITIGLPFPWLVWSMINSFAPVTVESEGLFCSIILLFLMLLFVIITIAVCRWRMTRTLGMTMFSLYAIFLTLSLLIEADIITCFSIGAPV